MENKPVEIIISNSEEPSLNERLRSVKSIEYIGWEDKIEIEMQSGASVIIPLTMISEFDKATYDMLQNNLIVSSGGDAISLRELDVDISVTGLLMDVFGLRS